MQFHVEFLSPGSTPTWEHHTKIYNVSETLRRIIQKQCTTKTSDLVRLFMHWSSRKLLLVVRLRIYFSWRDGENDN